MEKVAVSASAEPVFVVDERYLSICIDIGQIAEPTRFWNPDGSGETVGGPSYNFANERLVNITAALSPGYLRIGGTEADRAYYALDGPVPSKPPAPFRSVLSAKHIDAIGTFAKATGLDICFAVNAGWGARAADAAGGSACAWRSTQTRDLMRYVASRGWPFRVWELGNEPNAWPLFHHGLTVQPEQYAAELHELGRARDAESPHALIAGPGTAFWPTTGEVPSLSLASACRPILIRRFLRRFLAASAALTPPDIVTWHYYPGLSDRSALAKHRTLAGAVAVGALPAAAVLIAAGLSPAGGVGGLDSLAARAAATAAGLVLAALAFLCGVVFLAVRPIGRRTFWTPSNLDTCRQFAAQVRDSSRLVNEAARPAMWLGETGSAQVGGQPGVSGRWGGTIWWLDQLGCLALLGQRVQCRQTLSGSDYGLLDRSAQQQPTPDYWASVLWKRLMGREVHSVVATNRPTTLRIYCHRSPPAGEGAASPLERRLTYLAINLGDEPVALELCERSEPCEVWLLDAAAADSPTLRINGVEPRVDADGHLDPQQLRACVHTAGVVTVPPGGACFTRVRARGS